MLFIVGGHMSWLCTGAPNERVKPFARLSGTCTRKEIGQGVAFQCCIPIDMAAPAAFPL